MTIEELEKIRESYKNDTLKIKYQPSKNRYKITYCLVEYIEEPLHDEDGWSSHDALEYRSVAGSDATERCEALFLEHENDCGNEGLSETVREPLLDKSSRGQVHYRLSGIVREVMTDICSVCGKCQEAKTMSDITEDSFDLICDDCLELRLQLMDKGWSWSWNLKGGWIVNDKTNDHE